MSGLNDVDASAPTPRALEGIVVLEIDDGRAQYAGKMLGDLGATVIKIESPEGSSSRHVGPYLHDVPNPEGSLEFWHYNTSKRSLVLDLLDEADRVRLLDLASTADVVVDGLGLGVMESMGLGASELESLNPGLIYCKVTGFGSAGPWSTYRTSDLVHLALGGVAAVCGYNVPQDEGPIAPLGGQAANMTGMLAASAVLAALHARRRIGHGQRIDLASHDVISLSTEMIIPYWEFRRMNGIRQSGRHARPYLTPRWNHRCRDGKYINALPLYLDDERFAKMVDWFDAEGCVQDLRSPQYTTDQDRAARMDHIVDVIGDMCAAHDCDYMVNEAQQRRLPWGPINSPDLLTSDPHLTDRGAFIALEHDAVGESFTYPGAPYKLSGTPWSTSRAPRLGEHSDSFLGRGHGAE